MRSRRSASFSRRPPDPECCSACSPTSATCRVSSTTAASTRACRRSSTASKGGRRSAQPRLLPVDRPRLLPVIVEALGSAGLDHHDRRRRAGDHREAVRHDLGAARELNRRSCESSTSGRSSASTITWARRRCRTSWRSASPTASSSRSGTATTSTTCRSRWPRTLGVEHARRLLRAARARCATWSRTTCMQLLALMAMEPPVSLRRRRGARREGQGAAGHPADRPRTCGDVAVRAQYAAGLVGGKQVPGYREEAGVAPDSTTETYVGARACDRQLALGGRAVLPAHRQAPGAQGHRDRHPVQAGAATCRSARTAAGRAPQPAGLTDSA